MTKIQPVLASMSASTIARQFPFRAGTLAASEALAGVGTAIANVAKWERLSPHPVFGKTHVMTCGAP